MGPSPGTLADILEKDESFEARYGDHTAEAVIGCLRAYGDMRPDLGGGKPEELPTLQAVADRYIQMVLGAVEGNKTRAAKILGMDRRTLYRKLGS